jgi:hypothetical protein
MGKLERTEERRNRFNGESVMLTKEEAEKHDAIFMHELMATIEVSVRLVTMGALTRAHVPWTNRGTKPNPK